MSGLKSFLIRCERTLLLGFGMLAMVRAGRADMAGRMDIVCISERQGSLSIFVNIMALGRRMYYDRINSARMVILQDIKGGPHFAQNVKEICTW